MVFSSPIFLFGFLPFLLVVYFLTPHKAKNIILLIASLLFYAWGEGVYLALMLVSIVANFFAGKWIESAQVYAEGEHKNHSKAILAVGLTFNLLLLISYKYLNFIADSINSFIANFGDLSVSLEPIHLPLGISFFTFQSMSYLIDIYRKEIKAQTNILNLGLYISMFPQLIAGPIVRYKTIVNEINHRVVSSSLFFSGLERFIYGLAKKMLIANPLGYVVDTAFTLPLSELPTHVAWFVIVCYALQIYFDFSGYSDMAIGLGRMLGFRFLENFNLPYIARSLQEFWRRWHISLSSWFRDYLYIPLGGNRVSPIRTYVNLSIVFLLCGLWHGASWNFIAWGAFHGFVLILERKGLVNFVGRLWRPIQHLYLLVLVLVSWVFFRAETLGDALTYLKLMFSFNFFAAPFEIIDSLSINVYVALLAGVILSCSFRLPWFAINRQISIEENVTESNTVVLGKTLWMGFLLFSCVMSLAVSSHNPFIYFRF